MVIHSGADRLCRRLAQIELKCLPIKTGAGEGRMEADPKRIAREWNREIEAETHRRAAGHDDGPWKIVVWVGLAIVWSVALFAVIALFERLQR